MKQVNAPQAIAGRFSKHIALASAIAALAACTGTSDPSSSSVAQSSSQIAVSSSSAAPVSSSAPSSMPSSSSEPSSSSSAPVSSSSSAPVSSSSAPNNSDAINILGSNGTFDEGQGFFGGSVTAPVDASFAWNGEVDVQVNETSKETWHVQLTHGVSVQEGQQYTICFSAKAAASRTISVNIDQDGTPGVGQPETAGYQSVMATGGEEPVLITDYSDYQYTFTSTVEDTSARLTMNFGVQWVGDSAQPLNDANVQVDNIGVYAGAECGDPSKIPAEPVGMGSANIVGTPPITTEGNQVLFGGQQGSIAGMSLFWSNFSEGGKFYTQGVVEKLKNDWGSKLIRAAMGVEESGGYLTNKSDNLNRVKTVVDAAIANDMYVIIDWHTHYAQDYQPQAIEFFEDMARTYGQYDNVIYEIYNEPKCPAGTADADCNFETKTTWAEIKDYAEEVIAAIRAIDNDNLIIVGTPFYSQFVDEASESPINDVNVAYTLHFYAASTSHQTVLQNRARVALKNGIPLFVTEWGTVGASGDGAVNAEWSDNWMEFLYNNNISHANWSISDKAEGASLLKPGSNGANGWSESDLTESGLYVKQQIIGW